MKVYAPAKKIGKEYTLPIDAKQPARRFFACFIHIKNALFYRVHSFLRAGGLVCLKKAARRRGKTLPPSFAARRPISHFLRKKKKSTLFTECLLFGAADGT